MLEDDPDIKVVAEASDGEEAISLTRKLRPDVVVMDCALPVKTGMEATKEIHAELPGVAVLMLSMHSEETWVRRAMDAGANGYILKSAVDLDLPQAVKRVAQGELLLDPRISKPAALKGEKNAALTDRELEVLQLIVAGKSNKEIASELSLSVNTVAVHRSNIMDSLGIHKTAELVVYAIKNGLVNLS